MTILFVVAFLAGILTILAPCVLPILPVILGGTLNESNYKRILTIIGSFVISIIVFTFLLKVSTIFISVDQVVWTSLSGGILIIFGLITLFPNMRERMKSVVRRGSGGVPKQRSETLWGHILLGASLGPIFSGCSPTYSLIIATILPLSLREGSISIVLYALGLGVSVLIVALLGRSLIMRLHWLSDSTGWFKKTLGAIILLTGIVIISGFEQKIETSILNSGSFDITKFEQTILRFTNITKSEIDTIGTNTTTNLNQAPEFVGLTNWINSSGYTSMQELRGKIVLIDFWTYSCINCQRTLPYLEAWYQKYQKDGLVIIGVQAPEFAFEKKLSNLIAASKQFGLTYPLVQDNNYELRNAYGNQYRPAKYLIDQNGNIVYSHFGEGNYLVTEMNIQKLLNIQTPAVSDVVATIAPSATPAMLISPETYFGSDRNINQDLWSTVGQRSSQPEYIELQSPTGAINLNFDGAEANIVLSNITTGAISVSVDNSPQKSLTLKGDNLYNLFKGAYGSHKLTVFFKQTPLLRAYTFTFG